MSKLMLMIVGAVACAGARAEEPVRYWGVHGGQNNLKRWDAAIDFGSGEPFSGRADLDRGWHGGVQVGRQREHARYELEYQAGTIKVERLTLQDISEKAHGRGRYQAVLANAYRIDAISDNVGTLLGAGIGWGKAKLPHLGIGQSCDCFGPASKSGLTWQLRAGLSYKLSPENSVALQYTMLNLPEPEAGGPPAIRYAKRRLGALTLSYSRQF